MECVLVGGVVGQFISSLSCLLITMAKDRRWPPRGGALKHREQKQRRRSQAAWSLSLDTASRIVANFTPSGSLEALGILLMISTGHFGGRGASDSNKAGWPELLISGRQCGRDAGGGEAEVGWIEGGQREPGQREATGPWRQSTPAVVREMVRQQTLQEKHLKNEQRSEDAADKKSTNTSGVGKINNYYEDIYIFVYNNTD